jgi:hypothetical protein
MKLAATTERRSAAREPPPLAFTREANNLEDAVRSAIADVNKAGFTVARVEPAEESVYTKINHELARN